MVIDPCGLNKTPEIQQVDLPQPLPAKEEFAVPIVRLVIRTPPLDLVEYCLLSFSRRSSPHSLLESNVDMLIPHLLRMRFQYNH